MKKLFLIFLLFGIIASGFAQEKVIELTGTVSYISSQNVYVKFLSAKSILAGDKIYIRKDSLLIPVVSVDNCSSTSCVGKPIGNEKLKIGDQVIALIPKTKANKELETQQLELEKVVADTTASGVKEPAKVTSERKQELRGRLQFSSFSNFAGAAGKDVHSLRYTFSMDINHIANSRLSFESYVSFSHKLNDWALIRNNIFNGLKIYGLNLKYDAGKHTEISVGRKINPNIASMGAMDGIQTESKYKHFFWGAVSGFRPDYNYGFTTSLLEYGGYLGHLSENENGRMQTSIGLFEQTNSGRTDRRFAYFQHDNSLFKNVNIFISSELDLFKLVKYKTATDSGYQSATDMILTSLYLSANYRVSKKLSLSGSYDNRKNVIYYETFKSSLDQFLENATRQGIQLRANYRPIQLINTGLTASYRDGSRDRQPTINSTAFVSYSSIPRIDATGTLSANFISTSYLTGVVSGIRFDKDYYEGKLNLGLNYRLVFYEYRNGSGTLIQNIGEVELSFQVSRKFSMSANYEGTFEKGNNYHCIYLGVIKRF